MLALIATVFVASLLGSLHCAGMCGAFVAFAVGGKPRVPMLAAYNAGRLVTYVVLGVLAGLAGSAVDLGGSLIGVERAAAVAAGGMMVIFGGITLARLLGVKLGQFRLPAVVTRLNMAGHRAAGALPPTARAGAIGLLTTLLPCGWLYAFVMTAAGTGHPVSGALVMAVFWLGTLPMLVALGAGVQRLGGRLAGRLSLAAALAIVVVGLYTVGTRLHAAQAIAAMRPPAGGGSIIEQIEQDPHALPCCTRP